MGQEIPENQKFIVSVDNQIAIKYWAKAEYCEEMSKYLKREAVRFKNLAAAYSYNGK